MERFSDHEVPESKKKNKWATWVKALTAYFCFLAILVWATESQHHRLQKISQYFLADIDSSTSGIVTESHKRTVISRYGGYTHDFKYKYQIGNKYYFGNLINYKRPDRDVEAVLRQYPVGKPVTVFYDSKNPNYSVLIKDRLDPGYLAMLLITLALSPLLILGAYAFFDDG